MYKMEEITFVVLKLKFWICTVFWTFVFINCCCCQSEDSVAGQRFELEGKVAVPGASEDWMSSVRILVDGGQYLGLLK